MLGSDPVLYKGGLNKTQLNRHHTTDRNTILGDSYESGPNKTQ